MKRFNVHYMIGLLLVFGFSLQVRSEKLSAGTSVVMQSVISGYSDNFSTDSRVDNWTGTSAYTFSWDAANKWLQLQMKSSQWSRTDIKLRDELNNPIKLDMTGVPYIRFKAFADVKTNAVNLKLIDGDGHKNDHWSNPDTKVNFAGGKWEEFFIDFTGKLFYDNKINNIDLTKITGVHFDVTDGLSNAQIKIDDFRMGVEAMPNNKPTVNRPVRPKYMLVTAGVQTIQLDGIDDGNPERDENITITAKSSNQAIIADKDIKVTYGGGSTATLAYSPAGQRGIAEIQITIADDRGTAFSGENDTENIALVVEIRDPAVNNLPVCDQVVSNLYSGRGQQVFYIPSIDDGDDDKTQNVTVIVISKDLSRLTIDSVSFKSPNRVAYVYAKDKSVLGPVDIEITLKDDGGGTDTYVKTQTLQINQFISPCANFVQYDVQQWQPRPTNKDIPTVGSYVKICQTNTPIELYQRDFFWAKMYGYIVPTYTDSYTFQGFSNEGLYFYMNLSDGVSTDPAKLTTLTEDAKSTWTSAAIPLVAGKVYYFEAYAREIVNTFPFWLKWSSSKVPLGFISGNNLSPDYDITKPTSPTKLQLVSRGVNDITLSWIASTDNKKIAGYRIYRNGNLVSPSLITETKFQVNSLDENTSYSFHVVAVDDSDNSSLPTPVLNAATFPKDVIAPPPPQNVNAEFVTSFGVKLRWNASVDGETQVRGYNIYQENVLVAQNITETSLLIKGLSPELNYKFTVTAIDAGMNESVKSVPASIQTPAFNPNETRDGVRKGRLSINLNPLCTFDGFGVGLNYDRGSSITSNMITFSGFESSRMDGMTNPGEFGKEVTNATFARVNTNPFEGKYCAKISMVQGGFLRCNFGARIDKQYTYLARFAMRKSPAYSGDIQVKVSGRFEGTFIAKTITPTDEWKQYEVLLTTNYDGAEPVWYLDFIASAPGDIFIDNIEFVNESAYIPGSPFSKITLDLLREFKPASVRWGAIEANTESFKYSSGKESEATLSYADWLHLCNELKAKAFYATGISNSTDFKVNTQTFKTFTEYLAGDASTPGGAIRAKEGYGDLISKSKGIIIELGNEVWGAATHKAEIGSDYTAYGNWAREVAKIIKSAQGYNRDKMLIAYSGRSPGTNYGLHKSMLTGDNGELDLLSISGYMGGNLNLEPNIPIGTSQLDYHKNSIVKLEENFIGLKNDWKEMLSYTGRILPMYMYEGNMTQDSYFGRLGQAVTFADYYSSVPLLGVPYVNIFHFDGGQWKMIDNANKQKKLPLFHIGKYINKYCTGTMLETQFTSDYKLYSGRFALTIDPVGCKAYTDSTSYSVAMFSRDFENDYVVQVDIPDNVGNGATCKMITIRGESYSSTDVLIDEKNLTNFADSILVTVPKYGVVILRFDGIDQHYKAAHHYTNYKKVQSVKISTVGDAKAIPADKGKLSMLATVLPADAFFSTINWHILDNETIGSFLTISSKYRVLNASGLSAGNGTVRVVASTSDGSMLSDTITVVISNQGITGFNELSTSKIQLFPIPATDYLMVRLSDKVFKSLKIMDLTGREILYQRISGNEARLDMKNLKPGLYLLKVEYDSGTELIKFIKN